jgi:hypothetical protein
MPVAAQLAAGNQLNRDRTTMTLAIQFAIAIAMFIIAGGMIFYEYARSKAGRPLRNNEVTAMPYWLAYLMLLVLGTCVLVTAIVR